MIKSDIAIELYKAFRPYVDKKNIENYDSFLNRKMKNEKLIANLLKKYIDLKQCSHNLKKTHDILIINYALFEFPLLGLKTTKLFRDYLKKEKQYLEKNRKK